MALRIFEFQLALRFQGILSLGIALTSFSPAELFARKLETDASKDLKIRIPRFDVEKFRAGAERREPPLDFRKKQGVSDVEPIPDVAPPSHDEFWSEVGEDGAPPNVFLDVDAHMSAPSGFVRSQLELAMDRLIAKHTKGEREAFLKLSAKAKKTFNPNQDGGGCFITRSYNTVTESTELKLTHPALIKMISRTMLKSLCSEKDNLPAGASKALAVLGSRPGAVSDGDVLLKAKFRPAPGVSPLVQVASLSYGLAMQESKGNLLAGYHKMGGVQSMEAGPFQNSGTGIYAAGHFNPEGAKLMEALAADYHSRMMKIVEDKQQVADSGWRSDAGFASRYEAGRKLAAAGVSRDPALEFDKLCGVSDFNDKSYWYQKESDKVSGDKKEDVMNRAILDAWRTDIRRTRGSEVLDPDEILQAKMRRIVKGEADDSGSTLTYAQLAFEEMQKASESAKAGFARLADSQDNFIVTEKYLAGSTSPNKADPKEGLRLAKALRTMNLFCPKFAGEMSALMMRFHANHYGPFLRPEVVAGCRNYFAQLEKDFRSMVGKAPSESKYCRATLGEEFR